MDMPPKLTFKVPEPFGRIFPRAPRAVGRAAPRNQSIGRRKPVTPEKQCARVSGSCLRRPANPVPVMRGPKARNLFDILQTHRRFGLHRSLYAPPDDLIPMPGGRPKSWTH